MKSIATYLVLFFALWLTACKEKPASPDTITCEEAALDLYYQYADKENLTVAYLADLDINGRCINALLLQANNETDWATLKQEFGIMAFDSTVFGCPAGEDPVMVGVGIEADFLDDAILDTLSDISQIPEEEIERLTLVFADKIREIMYSFQSPDSLLPNTAIVVGQGEVKPEASDVTYDDYLLTVSRAIVVGMINERIHAPQSNKSKVSEMIGRNDRIMDNAHDHGHIGYVTAADNKNHALWLFFYDDQEECNNIIAHISEDIIIK